jgi:hypothetical protein
MRIPGIEGFGEQIAKPARYNETQTPLAAFGVGLGSAVANIGADLQATQQREEAIASAEAKAAQKEADRIAKEEARIAMAEHKAAQKSKALQGQQRTQIDLEDLAASMKEGIETRAVDPSEARKLYREQATKIAEGHMEGVPAEYKSTVQLDVDRHVSRLERTTIFGAVRASNRATVKDGINTTIEYAQRLHLSNPLAAEQLATATLHEMGPHAGMSAAEIGTGLQKFKEQTQYTAAASLIDNARGDPKKLQEAAKAVDNFDALDPEKKRQLKDKAFDQNLRIQEVNAHKAAAASRAQEVALKKAEAAHTAATAMSDKGVLTAEQRDVFAKQMKGTPYAESFRALMENQAVTGVLAMQPPKVLQAEIDRLQADIRTGGIDAAKETRLKQVERVKAGQDADIAKDPLRAFTERHASGPVPSIDTSNPQAFAKTIVERLAMAQGATVWAGKDTGPLFKEEIPAVIKMLDVLPDNSKGEALGMIARQLGRSATKGLASQIDAKDKALQSAFLSAASGTPEGEANAKSILRGAKAIHDKTVAKDEKAMTGWSASIAKQLDGVLMNPANMEQVAEAARYMTASDALDRGGVASSSTVRKAVEKALGGKIVEQGDGKVVLPAGFSHSQLTDRLRTTTRDELLSQAPGGTVRAAGVEVFLEDVIKSLPGATLGTVGPGKYIVLVPRVPGAKPDSPVMAGQKPLVVGFP